MYGNLSQEQVDLFHACTKRVMPVELIPGCALSKAEIKRLIPHRPPMLLVDRLAAIDRKKGNALAYFDLKHGKKAMSGHFPSGPIWPGVLQIESIGQVGALIFALLNDQKVSNVSVTHVCGARFMHAIAPDNLVSEGGTIEFRVQIFMEEPFAIFIGQTIYHQKICSVAAVKEYYHGSQSGI